MHWSPRWTDAPAAISSHHLLFIAKRGSWSHSTKVGHRVAQVTLDGASAIYRVTYAKH
jgi:hypothetical protein